ncbi:MAG TPA: type IV secretion system protein B4 [Pseudomonas xinjiangensis]|uniref:Type IV secretion system protein B4 n=2 Tax=root TaxID=1 RepID=A0A7V1FTI7_9GAMM|nr:type IV secretion system protein B4 [Halopseudomonas xinjiangensis]HEC46514.1 type IV secretion system protein B4 [Halopseudomonas xinjiangensis]
MLTAKQAGAPLNEALYPAGIWKEFVLSHAGSLLGGLELSGVDPKGLSDSDFESASALLRNILQTLNQDAVVTQYYWHHEGAKVRLKPRDNPRSMMLSKRREAFLNESRNLSTGRLFWLLDIPSDENINKFFTPATFKMMLSAPFEKKSREQLKARFTHWGAWLAERDELRRQVDVLDGALEDLDAKLQVVSPSNSRLTPNALWALSRALVNLNPDYLDASLGETVPVEEWDRLLADGDIHAVNIDGLDCLKIEGPEPVYARIASMVGYGGEAVPEGMWGRGDTKPILQKGNYLVMTRYRPLSAVSRALMIAGKESELHRSQMKLSQLLKGEDVSSEIERKINENKALKDKVAELQEAERTPDRFCHFHAHVVVFDRNPGKLRQACRQMNTALTQNGFHPVWETAGLVDLFPMLLPGYPNRCFRSTEFTSSQAGACSLVFKSSEGIKEWGAEKEEAVYILESDDGTPFHYTPFIGDKCLVLGVGPTRSGKTFMKNVMAGHFLKYGQNGQGALYHAIDVDPGTEPLALFFKEQGGIFRIEDPQNDRGANPFVAADGPDDASFMHHMLSQIRIMLSLNDSEALRTLAPYEQIELDRAIKSVLLLPANMRNLSSLSDHCGQELRLKLARWVKGGMYGNLFDNVEDGIGALDQRLAVYNLSGVKDLPQLAQLVMNEIFYRVIKVFENRQYRGVPKFLEIDEAQYIFGIPGSVETAVAKARTWFKHYGGMGFWTQSPEHYMNIKEWATLRSSASTWIFMPDQQMDRAMYQKAFQLKEGECDAIASLIPRKQAYIIQREVGISKTVNLNVANEEYVIATSRPNEAVIVKQMLETYPDIDEAVTNMVKRIFTAETEE